MSEASLEETIKNFILSEFLPGEDPANLLDDTPLITSGILDSLATMKLVTFVEEAFSIKIEPHETDPEYIGSIDSIKELIISKINS